jgi:hypothetical protein
MIPSSIVHLTEAAYAIALITLTFICSYRLHHAPENMRWQVKAGKVGILFFCVVTLGGLAKGTHPPVELTNIFFAVTAAWLEAWTPRLNKGDSLLKR